MLYQARYHFGGDENDDPGNYPAGPLVLMRADGQRSSILAENDRFPAPWLPYFWLNEQLILLPRAGSFMVLTRDGRVLFEQSMSTGSLVVPSPDHTLLAYVDFVDGDRSDPQVYILDIETGSIHSAGPASDLWKEYGSNDTSILRWSDDGAMLAWNRTTSYEEISVGELYVHDVDTHGTELITSDFLHISTRIEPNNQSSYGDFDGSFSWLQGETLLEYIVDTGAGLELTLADPIEQTTQTIGMIAPGLDTACRYARVWRSRKQVLWNRCGDGVYYSRIGVDQEVSSDKVYERDLSYPRQSKNHEFVVAQSLVLSKPLGRDQYWVVFDFVVGKMLKVEIPPQHAQPVLMTLLQ
tara:strand:- start:193960 stop:195018 length:1059 start_codon:yes stop_codon:yes gene_type:complete